VKHAPFLAVFVPLEGRAYAVLVADSFEDEERLAVDVSTRRLLEEMIAALLALADALDKEQAA
jgi:hypothetical protein